MAGAECGGPLARDHKLISVVCGEEAPSAALPGPRQARGYLTSVSVALQRGEAPEHQQEVGAVFAQVLEDAGVDW